MSLTGWVGNLFIVVGLWLIGSKKTYALYFTIVGELIWVGEAIRRGQYDLAFICLVFSILAFICLVFSILAFINMIKWSRGEKQ